MKKIAICITLMIGMSAAARADDHTTVISCSHESREPGGIFEESVEVIRWSSGEYTFHAERRNHIDTFCLPSMGCYKNGETVEKEGDYDIYHGASLTFAAICAGYMQFDDPGHGITFNFKRAFECVEKR